MKRTILVLSVLLAITAPASAAFLAANSPLGESFLDTGIEKVAGDVSLEVPMGCGRAWLERTAECFVAPSEIETAFGHGARHLEGTGLSQGAVEGAINQQIQAQAAQGAKFGGGFWGRVQVGGQTIEYRA